MRALALLDGLIAFLSRLGAGGRGEVYRAIAPARVERNRA